MFHIYIGYFEHKSYTVGEDRMKTEKIMKYLALIKTRKKIAEKDLRFEWFR